MTEGQVFPEQDAAGLGMRRAEPTTAGAKLKAMREGAGMHIGFLAATLKVPQARLEALEADRLAELPDATFARALAKAVCRVLKVDPAEVLKLLPATAEPGLERVSKGLNQPFRPQALGGEGVSLAVLRKPVVLAPLGLLAAAAAVYLLPADFASRWRTAPAASEPAFDPQPAPVVDAASAVLLPALTSAPAPASSAPLESPAASAVPLAIAPAVMAAPAQVATAPAPAPAPVAAPVEQARPAAASAAPTPAVATAGLAPLVLRASADSWVEVVDARGQVQYSRLMRAGEVADLQVQTPVKLRVGNVSGTQLSLRGTAVDLQARSRDNVARLELP